MQKIIIVLASVFLASGALADVQFEARYETKKFCTTLDCDSAGQLFNELEGKGLMFDTLIAAENQCKEAGYSKCVRVSSTIDACNDLQYNSGNKYRDCWTRVVVRGYK